MTTVRKPSTQQSNGKLWGTHAHDWSQIQEAQCSDAYDEAIKRLKPGPHASYLDLGCGSGGALRLAHQQGANVHGLDASQPLLDIAQTRIPEGSFHYGDLDTLPYSDNSFDMVSAFNAIQYAANPALAMKEVQRVTKPKGLVLVMTWGEPENMPAASLVAALKPLLPPPPPGAPGPFALSQRNVLHQFAQDAQLEVLEIYDVDCLWDYPDLATGVRGLGSSGVSVKAALHSGQAEVDEAHGQALKPFITQQGRYQIPASFRCLLAQAS